MTAITHISIDVAKENILPMVWIKAGDENSRKIIVTVCNNGFPVNIPESSQITVNVRRSDGLCKSFPADLDEDGTITFIFPDWCTQLAGLGTCSISIIDSESLLSTFSFQIFVQCSERTPSGAYYVFTQSLFGTYYLIYDGIPYSFTLREVVPMGGALVFNDNYTSLTTYQDNSLQYAIESGISVLQQPAGTFLPPDDMFSTDRRLFWQTF